MDRNWGRTNEAFTRKIVWGRFILPFNKTLLQILLKKEQFFDQTWYNTKDLHVVCKLNKDLFETSFLF